MSAQTESQPPVALSAHTASPTRFNLSRWFAVVALLSIAAISVAMGALLNRFITQRLLWQEAVLTKEFVQSLVQVEESLQTYFADPVARPRCGNRDRFHAHRRLARHAARECLRPAADASSGRAIGS